MLNSSDDLKYSHAISKGWSDAVCRWRNFNLTGDRTESDPNPNPPGTRTSVRAFKLSEIPPNRHVNSNLPALCAGWRQSIPVLADGLCQQEAGITFSAISLIYAVFL